MTHSTMSHVSATYGNCTEEQASTNRHYQPFSSLLDAKLLMPVVVHVTLLLVEQWFPKWLYDWLFS